MWSSSASRTIIPHQKDLSSAYIRCISDSTVVLNWLDGSPRRFKTNQSLITFLPSVRIIPWIWKSSWLCLLRFVSWRASESLAVVDWTPLVEVTYYWMACTVRIASHEEERDICHVMDCQPMEAIPVPSNYSSFSRLQRVTAWVFMDLICQWHSLWYNN